MTAPIVSPNQDSDNLKRCTKCGVEKPATTEYFYLEVGGGLRTRCKECVKRATRLYERANPKKLREAKAVPKEVRPGQQKCTKCGEWKPATTEFYARYQGKRPGMQKRCRECCCQQSRAYYAANVDKMRERSRNWQLANPDKVKASRRKNTHLRSNRYRRYYQSHRDKLREYNREWQRANPDKVRAKRHKRRAKQLKNGGTHTAEDIQAQYNSQRGKCWWCGKKVGTKYDVDHRIPLSRGGSNAPENLVISCRKCNRSKGDKLPQEWSDRLL